MGCGGVGRHASPGSRRSAAPAVGVSHAFRGERRRLLRAGGLSPEGMRCVFGKDLPMIEQTTPAGQVSAGRLSPEEALVSLLIASARADGSVSVHEANTIEHVVGGMKLFRDYSGERLQKV